MTRARRYLLLPLLLTACQTPQQRQETAQLQERVDKLEKQVAALQGQVDTLRSRSLTVNASSATQAAAADACALDVARDQQSYLDANGHYATSDSQLPPPGSCSDLSLKWLKRAAQGYHFQVLDAGGQVLSQRDSKG